VCKSCKLRPFLGCPICPDSPFSRAQSSRPPNENRAVLTNAVEVGGMPLKVEQVRQSDVFVGFLLFRPRVNGTIVLLDLRFFEVFRFRPRVRGTS
jgi:hypothetical protein